MEEGYVGFIILSGVGMLLSGGLTYFFQRRKRLLLTKELNQLKESYVVLSKDYQQLSKQHLALKEYEGETLILLEENQKLRVTVDALQNENTLIRAKHERLNLQEANRLRRSKEDEKMLKEMLKYARDLSHPDKGGTNDRFIRYNKTYNRYLKQQ